MIFDSGALIGLDRGDQAMWVRLKAAPLAGDPAIALLAAHGDEILTSDPRSHRSGRSHRAPNRGR